MADWQQWGQKWHADRLAEWVAQAIILRYVGVPDIDVSIPDATPDRHERETTDNVLNLLLQSELRDWIVSVSQCVVDGKFREPSPGDKIIWSNGDNNFEFEVAQPDQSSPAWEWYDTYHTKIRIHTKLCDWPQFYEKI